MGKQSLKEVQIRVYVPREESDRGLPETLAWCLSMGPELGHSSSAVAGSLTAGLPEAPCLRKALVKRSLPPDPTLLLLGCFKLTGQLPKLKLLYVIRLIAG